MIPAHLFPPRVVRDEGPKHGQSSHPTFGTPESRPVTALRPEIGPSKGFISRVVSSPVSDPEQLFLSADLTERLRDFVAPEPQPAEPPRCATPSSIDGSDRISSPTLGGQYCTPIRGQSSTPFDSGPGGCSRNLDLCPPNQPAHPGFALLPRVGTRLEDGGPEPPGCGEKSLLLVRAYSFAACLHRTHASAGRCSSVRADSSLQAISPI